jgi:hypothetical protein
MSGSDLCQKTSTTISGLLLLLGDPKILDVGEVFNTGSNLFNKVGDEIEKAIPGTNWLGDAAEKYSLQNTAQKLRAKAMGDIDKLTGGFVSNQAEYIANTRKVLNAMRDMVNGVKKACVWAEDNLWIIGEAASWAMAIPACALAMGVVGGAMLYLTIMTMTNTQNLKGMLPRLIDMLTTLPKLSDLIPGLPDIKLPDFNLPDFKFPPDFSLPDFGLPDIKLPDFQWPDFPNMPGFPDFQWPDFNFPGFPDFGLPNLPIPHLPGLPSLPDLFPGFPGLKDLFPFGGGIPKLPNWADLPALPDFLSGFPGMPNLANFGNILSLANMPSMQQLTATLSQLSSLSGSMGGPGQMASMAGSQTSSLVGQVSQAGQQDDEDRGAGAGTDGAERAPVDATGGSGAQPGQGRVL